MLKLYLLATAALFVIGGCASSENNKQQSDATDSSYPNLIELKKPGEKQHQQAKVYIDSVKQITTDSKKALLISGNLPDGCTHLESVSHHTEDHSLVLDVSTWRDTGAICTQALVPFSFIYEKPDAEEISTHSHATVNGKTYSL